MYQSAVVEAEASLFNYRPTMTSGVDVIVVHPEDVDVNRAADNSKKRTSQGPNVPKKLKPKRASSSGVSSNHPNHARASAVLLPTAVEDTLLEYEDIEDDDSRDHLQVSVDNSVFDVDEEQKSIANGEWQ